MLNNYGKYNATEEKVRLAELVQCLEDEPAIVDWANSQEQEREDCSNCLYPNRKCSECINKPRKENGEDENE